MSKENYDAKLPVIDAIPEKVVVSPNLPVAVALQEAEDLLEWCKDHKEKLVKADLDWALVEDLPQRIGACRYSQSQWQKEYKSMEDAQKEWNQKSPDAYALRDDLLHHFFRAFRKMPDLTGRVQKIAEGSGHADMLQDLSDLAVLGKANTEPLTKIGLNLGLLDQAATTSEQLAVLLAKANGARLSDNSLKIIRDKAYTHMKEGIDEIREAGQYVFYRNEDRKKGYVSAYTKKRKNNSKDKPDDTGTSKTS